MSKEVAEEYLSSLADLTVNSKPLINMLTMLADENVDHAPAIVQVIENHIEKVPPEVKLPILYLIDSIIKNVSKVYVPLFTQNIVNVFVSVFEKVDERTRLNMYKLRQTWADVFPARKLYALDLLVKNIDQAWPVTAPTPTSIHFNPKFLGSKTSTVEVNAGTPTLSQSATPISGTTTVTVTTAATSETPESVLREQLLKKQQILIELQQKKLELELMQTKAIIEGQENQLTDSSGHIMNNLVRPPINEDAAKLFSQRAAAKSKAVVLTPSTVLPKMCGTLTSAPNKMKIAPANTQLIKAAKSRDPRLARQQQQNKASLEVTHKEQEIYNRQLAMLKTPLVEQVAPVVPAQKVLSDSNVKGHITYNVKGHLEKDRLDVKNKKQIKEGKNKFKPLPSKEFKNSPNKNSKTFSSKNSKNLSARNPLRRNITDRSKSQKIERSVSPVSLLDSPGRDSRWSKGSNHRHSRSRSAKLSPKKGPNRSPRSSPAKSLQNLSDTYSPKNFKSASDNSDNLKTTHRKSKKKHKRTDDCFDKFGKVLDSIGREEEHSPTKIKLPTQVEEFRNSVNNRESEDISPSTLLKCTSLQDGKVPKPENAENEYILSNKSNSDVKNDVKIRDKVDIKFFKESSKGNKLVSLDLELIESSPSPEPPPPPVISRTQDSVCEKRDDVDFDEGSEDEKECRNEITGFKDLKGVSKGRNYIRRNRDRSASPKETDGDVDLRVSGPPEKQARLLFDESKTNNIESKKLSESLVNVSGKDVDLRLLTIRGGSPSKKRLSTETGVEEPPKKKNKSEIFDELFGSEDVDFRKMTRPALNPGDCLPSPPPPPVISNGPQGPQVATIAPLMIVDSNKTNPGENTCSEFSRENQMSDNQLLGNRGREGFDVSRGRYRKNWNDSKLKSETEIKPLILSSQLELELDPRKDMQFSSFDTDKPGKKHFKDRVSPRGELDRLGRPLLYNKLPNDPRARRESLGVLDGRDTDMRRLENLMDRDHDTNINVNMIIGQAADQVRNGTMSLQEYNELLKQVIHVNEKQKLMEAQNKSRQEMRRSQHHHRGRRSPNRYGVQNKNSPPMRIEDDRRERRPFNDIDERLQVPWRNVQPNDCGTGFNRGHYSGGPNRSTFDLSEYDERVIKPDIWEEETKRFRKSDEQENAENRVRDLMCNERTHDCVDVPPADPHVLEIVAKDPMKSINIDGTARDIRFYGDTAIVMLSWDDPKEISFENGVRRVAIGDISIMCALNDPYIMFMLNGNPHRIRLGAPTRELYIDGEFYEAHFGGPPVQIIIDGLPYLVQLEGPPPQVQIGKKRMDLICGRVNMIVDATAMLPLYLDAKPQRFDLRSRPYIFRLVNHLKTILVNEVPLDIHFGGGCRQICGYGNLHFLRLSALPNGVEPGRVKIINMENFGLPLVPNVSESIVPTGKSSPLPNETQPPSVSKDSLINSGADDIKQQESTQSEGGALDILTSLMSSASGPQQSVGFNYQIENKSNQLPLTSTTLRSDTEAVPVQSQTSSSIPLLGSGLNINDLFQKLVASGIVPTLSNSIENNQKSQIETQIKPIDFSDTNSLRERQPPIINSLYSGIQCSSCGVRFSPEETIKYSRHLDWHFRQNRREKDAARKGQSRKWYYDVSDWIQFEEIEDLEERAQSWFESEATTNAEEITVQEEVKTVPAPSGQGSTLCELCRDAFETYYNEEKEEWHLKPCIKVEGKYYHPLCYEDFEKVPEDSLLAEKSVDCSILLKNDIVGTSTKVIDVKENVHSEENVNNDTSIQDVVVEENEEECIKLSSIRDEHADDNATEIINKLLNEIVNCIAFKNEISQEVVNKEEHAEQENKKKSATDDEEEEIEVLESVSVEQKRNIIDVDLIEKLDDDDDDDDDDEEVYQRKTPSPIVLIPPSKIKQEPIDEMESPVAIVDQTITNVVSSIDGNVEMIDAPQLAQSAPSKIKITFNKPISTEQFAEKMNPHASTPDDVEPEPLPLKPKKPRIAEREMKVCLPCVKGTEVSGLCSIM